MRGITFTKKWEPGLKFWYVSIMGTSSLTYIIKCGDNAEEASDLSSQLNKLETVEEQIAFVEARGGNVRDIRKYIA